MVEILRSSRIPFYVVQCKETIMIFSFCSLRLNVICNDLTYFSFYKVHDFIGCLFKEIMCFIFVCLRLIMRISKIIYTKNMFAQMSWQWKCHRFIFVYANC